MNDTFHKLAAEWRDRIYSFALYSLRRREEAEDVTQDVLIRLWHHRNAIDTQRAGAWIMRVTRNAVIDATRRRTTRAAVFAPDIEAETAQLFVPSAARTDAMVEHREIRDAVEEALGHLEEPYRSVLVMREIEQLSYAEIAGALNMPMGTVKVYLHRGRRMLRESLRGRYRQDVI